MKSLILLIFLIFATQYAWATEEVKEATTLTLVFGVLFSISELLAHLKIFKDNSISEMIFRIIKSIYSSLKK